MGAAPKINPELEPLGEEKPHLRLVPSTEGLKPKPPFQRWFSVGLIVSLLVHVVGMTLHWGLPLATQPPPASNAPIEITEIPMSPAPSEREAVPKIAAPRPESEMAETKDALNREIDPDARFLGEHNQKVKLQTKAKRIDDFRDKKGTGAQSAQKTQGNIPPSGDEEQDKRENDAELADGTGVAPAKKGAGVKRDWKTLSLSDLSVPGGDGGATAASDDRLKGVDSGEDTMLSTREFKFYSYYHRIKELLRQHWKPSVERKLATMWIHGKNLNSEELVTRVLVLLDEKGTIQKISRVGSSGFSELDEAAVESFQRAGPFPNPPKGMMESDGFVRINWDFILKAEASPRIQFRSAGGGLPGPN